MFAIFVSDFRVKDAFLEDAFCFCAVLCAKVCCLRFQFTDSGLCNSEILSLFLSLSVLFLEVKEMVKIFFKMCIRLRESIPLLSISEMKKTNRCDIKQGFLTFAT